MQTPRGRKRNVTQSNYSCQTHKIILIGRSAIATGDNSIVSPPINSKYAVEENNERIAYHS